MPRMNFYRFAIFLTLLVLLPGGCVTTDPNSGEGSVPTGDQTVWLGEITGGAVGDLELLTWRVAESDSELQLRSKIKLKLQRIGHTAEHGTLRGELRGRIKDGLMEARLNGTAETSETDGAVSVSGVFIGTVSETQGFGTWKASGGDSGLLSGEWNMQRQ